MNAGLTIAMRPCYLAYQHMAKKLSFGEAVTIRRTTLGYDQKTLAAKIKREDGKPISPQYLNDIEHNRRSPSSDRLIRQVADALDMDAKYLTYVATGVIPEVADLIPAHSQEAYRETVEQIVDQLKKRPPQLRRTRR
jgi:transcriptional regulator with XRE-family HTH domain